MKKIIVLLVLSAVLISPIAFANPRPSTPTGPWFVSWTPNGGSAVGNETYSYDGFNWADAQSSTVTILADWGDGSPTNTYTSTGIWITNPPAYDQFFNGPNHLFTKVGSYTLTVELIDANNIYSATKSATITVTQGPNLPVGVFGSGGRSPTKM